ncbi:MAG TPA: hypothetical protein DCR93_27040, partial [Cytophagales bacterium]|nr:hypothetical protein [Cytophagales bacterium]
MLSTENLADPMSLLEKLQAFPEFASVPADQLQWLLDQSETVQYAKGDYLFQEGESTDQLVLVTEGEFVVKLRRNNQLRVVGRFGAPNIMGVLP